MFVVRSRCTVLNTTYSRIELLPRTFYGGNFHGGNSTVEISRPGNFLDVCFCIDQRFYSNISQTNASEHESRSTIQCHYITVRRPHKRRKRRSTTSTNTTRLIMSILQIWSTSSFHLHSVHRASRTMYRQSYRARRRSSEFPRLLMDRKESGPPSHVINTHHLPRLWACWT